MAIYFEPSSGVGSSSAELIEHAPHADSEEIIAVGRCQRRNGRRAAAKERVRVARPNDAIPAGTCSQCGCVGNHPRLEDCVEALRDWVAELTCAEIRAGVKKPRKKEA